MHPWDPSTYGDRAASVYDRLYGDVLDTDAAVDALYRLAAGGRVLELGIGTGRLALPLAQMGVEVHGIDSSDAMVERLRAKDGGAEIPVTMGDFRDVPVDDTFSLVFVAFNTFFGLTSQDEQIACMRNVVERLEPDGVFVIEAFVPDPARFDRGQRLAALKVDTNEVQLEASRHDPVAQTVHSQQIIVTEGSTSMVPVVIRYAWPSELDAMALVAGLMLRERWGGWRGEAFTSASTGHVSVYARG